MQRTIRYAAVGLLLLPLVASAATVEELRAQVQALLDQVNRLQQTGVGTTVTTGAPAVTTGGACPLIGRSLKRGSSGDDVTRLQQFLAQDITVYPEGQVSGYYGALTEAAVRRWQTKFNIVSSGSADTTGYGVVGPRTAAAIAIVCSGGSINGVSGVVSAAPVGGFIQVTPITGNSPLLVSVTATINTTNACGGALYTLDFGDGTVPQQIQKPAGACSQLSQTFPHTYFSGGTFLIKLSAGGHQTTATVVVNGATVSNTPSASDSIAANQQSGVAPLSVTFSGTVNAAGSCTGGTYTIEFGDGQTGQVNYAATCQAFKYNISHTYSSVGSFTARLKNPANTQVGSVVITTSAPPYTYAAPTITPGTSGNPLLVSLQFGIPTSCTGYSLTWGDNSAAVTQNDGGSSCAQTTATKSLSHQYTGSGTYTITLKRGSSLDRVDTASVVIQSQ